MLRALRKKNIIRKNTQRHFEKGRGLMAALIATRLVARGDYSLEEIFEITGVKLKRLQKDFF